ncbi:retrovirus-related Pol polyprotein from transposon 17.6 [Trichonephila clavata]|uniref:Retrovirus-related Pol polyprotein from transposon 17.6 n=1 Tax=Trichonephila clavata TaxID=2740835 RepID=A0A8X6KRT5_TRICU|nr:retrovirus-related Pol polyprotein from transposon 17.6 [Trichonephila clavata]
MAEAGIISKVEESTEWVVDSPKKLRICLDPRPLNEAIQRPHYPIPTADALVTTLQGASKKDSVWIWDTNIERDFELIKQAIVKSPCLKYFDKNKEVTVPVDDSKNGLGTVLLQEGHPVANGSVSLTQTQQRYAQIEKELLAMIYGLEHFNYYTYGRIVTVQTDHKPILGLSKKPYDIISPRLQRMLLILTKYNIQLEYVPIKNLVIADAQSTTDNFVEDLGQEATVRINLLTQASPTKWEKIAQMTTGDPEMQDVLFHINNGWSEKRKTKTAAQPYWHCREELYSTKEGIICR